MDQLDAHNGQPEEVQTEKEANTDELSMESLLAQDDISLNIPQPGEMKTGVIASIAGDEILVSIGAKSEGVVPSREVSQLPQEFRDSLKVGKEIKVYVVNTEGRYGTILLSVQRALEESDWDNAEDLMQNKEVYEGEINGYNKGGLIVHMGNLRGFVPASQVSLSRRMSYGGDSPDQRWSGMVGEPIVVRVIEVDRERRRLILSEKAASQESRETLKSRLLDELDEGMVRVGRVTSLADFGAFVNINGADGLVHLSEISWDHIDHPKEVLEVGQEVKVKIISIDRERKRIGLSLRQLKDDPWDESIEAYQVGQLVEGKITRLTKFGAFAQIEDNLEGLVHISELSDRRIEHPKEVLSEGDVITLRIIKIDTSRRRIGLSLRKVESQKYSEMDWEMALSELEGVSLADDDVEDDSEAYEDVEETVEAEAEADAMAEEVEETTAEADEEAEAVAEEVVAEAVEEAEVEATAEVEETETEADAVAEEEASEEEEDED
ncbi:MAG: S1 RNA-binding domain-containing protein [Anaerolineales bacterium]|nr:S1 RNA-binding domain-containing protein [Anaerolineales bacterium]